MRSKLIFAFILVLISSTWAGIEDGLIAHYAFDGDASDSSGNGNDATAYNDYEYIDGVFNDAIHLVGNGHTGLNGGHVILPFIALNEFPAFSISMWINHQGFTGSFGGENFIHIGDSGLGDYITIGHDGGFPGDVIHWTVGSVDDMGVIEIPYNDFANNWQHLVLRADNGTMTGFLNGQPIGTDSYQLDSMNPLSGLGVSFFGPGDTSNRFIGMIDDVGIWTRALSQNEIDDVYINGVPEPTTFLLFGLGGLLFRRRQK
jgi:hypothetical protein